MEEGENGGRSWPPLPTTGQPGQKQRFCDFLERRKRKGFRYFVVEARVDEWCYCMLKMVGKRNIYRGRLK